ncbi:MAG: hypothetical protein KBS59_00880 [Clostridiales bacterium]|nr:hypothetical protein [Clostridiales bacterium]
MDITYDRSRDNGITPVETLKSVFQNYICGECDAEYTNSDKNTVFGVCGLPYKMPVSAILMNSSEFIKYSGANTLIVCGNKIEAYSESGKIKLSKNAVAAV